jgi:hypothetical protein
MLSRIALLSDETVRASLEKVNLAQAAYDSVSDKSHYRCHVAYLPHLLG